MSKKKSPGAHESQTEKLGSEEFRKEIASFQPTIRRLLWKFSSKKADVDDLTQEVFRRLLELGEEKRQSVAALKAFAIITARNTAIDWGRKMSPILFADMNSVTRFDLESAPDRPDEIADAHESLNLLAEAVEKLPRRCRKIFILRKIERCSPKDIAKRLGLTERTVERDVQKSLESLKEMLGVLPVPLTYRFFGER